MLEPTWNPLALPDLRSPGMAPAGRAYRRVRLVRIRARTGAPKRTFWADAAPFTLAALWLAATGAAVTLWVVTGRRELFDWCRSDGVLGYAGALTALAVLAASAWGCRA
jgi:hypothetical protein